MNVSDALQAEAEVRCGLRVFEILQAAQELMGQSRWLRLRQRATVPVNEQEELYMYHLNMYVILKRSCAREDKNRPNYISYKDQFYYQELAKSKYHRDQMFNIEHGISVLPYSPSIGTGYIDNPSAGKEISYYEV